MEDNKRQKLIIISVSTLVVLILVIIFSLIGSSSPQDNSFQFVAVTPAEGSVIDPSQTTVSFELNKQLSLIQPDTFSISVTPSVDYVYGVVGDTLNINLSNLQLNDSVKYNVVVNGLKNRDDEVFSSLSTTFTVKFPAAAADLLDKLPFRGDGFTIVKLSDYTLYVSVSKKPIASYGQKASEYLAGLGIDNSKFDIAIQSPEEASQGDQTIDAD